MKILVASADARKAGYQMAQAFYEEGSIDYLDSFMTSLYYEPNKLYSQQLIKLFPRLGSRYLPGLPANKVQSIFLVDVIRKLRILNTPSRSALEFFDKEVKTRLSNQDWLLTSLDCCSEYAIPKAKKMGIKIAILCVAPSNQSWQKITEEELKLHPHISKSNDVFLTTPKWIMKRRHNDLDYADLIIAYSPFIKETLLEQGIDSSKIVVIHKGVDNSLPYFNCDSNLESNSKYFIDKSKFNILFVGNLGWRKGIYYLLEAVKKASLKNASILIVGGGEEWVSLIKEANKNIDIKLFGSVPHVNLAYFYQSSDIFFFPSLLEGAAHVTYEAMSFGLPIITTYNSGSLVEDGLDGYLVNIRDTCTMAERLERLYENPEIRLNMHENALRKSKEITWSKFRKEIRLCLERFS